MADLDGDAVLEPTDEQRGRLAAIPPLKDLEREKPGAAPIDLEHDAMEKAVGQPLPRIRPGR